MDNKLVSVVVPVYNAERYLKECIDSILEQIYSDIELILVDDGSIDDSPKICDIYAELDSRVVVIHQPNSGAAKARKTGILKAKGEYICFVDSDDKIASDMIEYFINHIGDSDLITSGCQCENGKHETFMRYDAFDSGVYETDNQMKNLLSNMFTFENRMEDGFLPFLVNKMYRSVILKDVVQSVDEKIVYAEDRDLLFRYILKCQSIVVTHEVFYFYRYNQSSIMNTPNKNIMRDLNALYLSLEKVFEGHVYQRELMKQLQLFITSRIYKITRFMHFPNETQTIRCVFPFINLLEKKRFILYGAGVIGMNYYRQLSSIKEGELLLWVDKQWEKYEEGPFEISSVDSIKNVEYDCILIAVKKEELAESIKKELVDFGVEEKKIWWKPPISIEV